MRTRRENRRVLGVPERVAGLPLVASVSGGKDSTAMVLALREAELEFRCVFADTGWEHPETLAYVDYLAETLGIEIERVGVPGGMVAVATKKAAFPMRKGRWCT